MMHFLMIFLLLAAHHVLDHHGEPLDQALNGTDRLQNQSLHLLRHIIDAIGDTTQ